MNFRFELNDGTTAMVYNVKPSEVIAIPDGAIGVSIFFAVSEPTVIAVTNDLEMIPISIPPA